MDSFWASAADVLRRVGGVLRMIFLVAYNGLAIEDLVMYVSVDVVEFYRDGWRFIRRAILWWLGISAALILLNLAVLHQTWIWSLIALVNVPVTTALLLWTVPIATVGAFLTALPSAEGNRDWTPAGIGNWVTSQPKDYWNRSVQNVKNYLHAVIWVIMGEVIASTYLHIFQVWKYPDAFPLLLHAIVALILLDRLHTPEERKLKQGRSIRPWLTSLMVSIVVICTGTFVFPQLAAALRNGLGKVDGFLTIPQVLPLVAFLLVAVPFVTRTKKGADGKVERPGAWAKWLMIMTPILYLEFLGARAAIVVWALPTMIWLFAALLIVNLAIAGFGLMMKEDAEHLGRRALKGKLLVNVAATVLVIFVGYATKPNYYEPKKQVRNGVSMVVSRVMVCPVDYQEFRGDKAHFDVCPRHGKDLVPFTSLPASVQDSLRTTPNNRDFPKIPVDKISLAGASSETIAWKPGMLSGATATGGTP